MTGREAELERQLARQRKLVHASYALHTSLDVDELLGLILKWAAEGVEGERGTVFLVSDDGGEIWSRVVSGDEELEIRLPIGKGIAGAVAKTGETIRIEDAYADGRFDRSWDEKSGFRTRQILCAPIRNRAGSIVGVFQLLNKRSGSFTEEDEEYLAALSVHAALAVENARLHQASIEKERQEREIRLARRVQRQIQPERAEAKVGAIVAAGMNELCEDASGDYYDFLVPLPGDRIGVAIGDVSGHGLQAALVMAEARAFLRAFVRTTQELREAMNLLNDHLVPDMPAGKFISMFAAVIDAATGRVEWCNAGHNAPLVIGGRDGEVRKLEASGRILGVLPDAAYRAGLPFTLEPGETIFLYTDGVTECRNRAEELWGEERLHALLREEAGSDPATLLQTVRRVLSAWTGKARNHDDITMVAVTRV
ncbi:MAG: PP2C family protein-serine/threonine phosphatase [Planctomycetota bacterium]